MELSDAEVARIRAALNEIQQIIYRAPAQQPTIPVIDAWVGEHLLWKPGNRVLCTDACDALAADTGIQMTPRRLARYIPWPRQRSNGQTWYLDAELIR